MRGLAFAFIASCIFWCLLTWCTVCACTVSGTMSACLSDLLASFACIGLSVIVICLYVTCFDDPEPDDSIPRDCLID